LTYTWKGSATPAGSGPVHLSDTQEA
jgi:hypothetical protein